jgi:hypothetical protein
VSEEQELAAIGLAVKNAKRSEQKALACEAELDRHAEQFKTVGNQLKQLVRLWLSKDFTVEDVIRNIDQLPEKSEIRRLVAEYHEEKQRSRELSARANQLSGVARESR